MSKFHLVSVILLFSREKRLRSYKKETNSWNIKKTSLGTWLPLSSSSRAQRDLLRSRTEREKRGHVSCSTQKTSPTMPDTEQMAFFPK